MSEQLNSDRRENEELADYICRRYDEIAFAALEKIWRKVHDEAQESEQD